MRDAARLAMEEILELDPYNADAMNFIAYQYAEDGVHLNKALALAQRALELNEAGHIYDTLGWVYYRLGRYDEALEPLRAALREMPDDPVIHEHLGDLYVALGEPRITSYNVCYTKLLRCPCPGRVRHCQSVARQCLCGF